MWILINKWKHNYLVTVFNRKHTYFLFHFIPIANLKFTHWAFKQMFTQRFKVKGKDTHALQNDSPFYCYQTNHVSAIVVYSSVWVCIETWGRGARGLYVCTRVRSRLNDKTATETTVRFVLQLWSCTMGPLAEWRTAHESLCCPLQVRSDTIERGSQKLMSLSSRCL